MSNLSLGAGFQLGLWGKKLIQCDIARLIPSEKGSKVSQPEAEKV